MDDLDSGERLTLRIPNELLDRVDAYVTARSPKHVRLSRNSALLVLIERALSSAGFKS